MEIEQLNHEASELSGPLSVEHEVLIMKARQVRTTSGPCHGTISPIPTAFHVKLFSSSAVCCCFFCSSEVDSHFVGDGVCEASLPMECSETNADAGHRLGCKFAGGGNSGETGKDTTVNTS